MSKNIKPRKEQDIGDDALSVANMLEGKVLEYKADFLKQGKTDKEFSKKFDGFFKSLDEKGELIKQVVILSELEKMIENMTTTPESRLVNQIDVLISKMAPELIKTNLPSMPPREDSVAKLDEEEAAEEENEDN